MTVRASRTLEGVLERHFGAIGKGLHEKVASVEHKLPAELVSTLRRIASVRNSAVQEDDFELRNPELFLEDVRRAIAILSSITGEQVVLPKGFAPSSAAGLLSKYSLAFLAVAVVAIVGLRWWDSSERTEHRGSGDKSERAPPPTPLAPVGPASATASPAAEEKPSSPASPTLEAGVTSEEARRPATIVSDGEAEGEARRRTMARGPQDGGVIGVRSGDADVRGSLSKVVVRGVVQRHIKEVQLCYEQELSARPDLSGRAQVKFIIAPSGAVQAANIESSTLGAAPTESCIAQAVRRWKFPSPHGGGIVIVSYPFLFGPSE